MTVLQRVFFAFALAALAAPMLQAQERVVDLWDGKIPGSVESPLYKEGLLTLEPGVTRIWRVTQPTLEVFPAPAESANGAAVIICPGGGYIRLAYQHEGIDVARWLNGAGVTGIVLKYRLPNDTIMKEKSIGPLQDVQEAVRVVRRHAKEWKIDPRRIGVMGFSAGGHLAASAATHYADRVYDADTVSARPDFSLLIYPVISMDEKLTHPGSRKYLLGTAPDRALVERFSNELQVTPDTPPAFLVHAADDRSVSVQNTIGYFLALKAKQVPAEMHIYEKGGHGFGLAPHRGTESGWPDACLTWMRSRGLLEKK